MEFDIFVSSTKSHEINVNALCELIKLERDIVSGGIKRSKIFLCCITLDYVRSKEKRIELEFAMFKEKKILWIIFEQNLHKLPKEEVLQKCGYLETYMHNQVYYNSDRNEEILRAINNILSENTNVENNQSCLQSQSFEKSNFTNNENYTDNNTIRINQNKNNENDYDIKNNKNEAREKMKPNFVFLERIPCIDFKRNIAPSIESSNFLQLHLQNEYKPSSMVILRLNHNLILIAVNKYMNKIKRRTSIFKSFTSLTSMFLTSESSSNGNQNYFSTLNSIDSSYENDYKENSDSIEESKLLVYSELGGLLCDIGYYIENSVKNKMQFEILSMCADEEQSDLYVSTSMRKIMRFKYTEDVLELVLDGILDLDGLDSMRAFEPAALHILDTPQSNSPNNARNQNLSQQNNRVLLLSDRGNKRLTAIGITTTRTADNKIKCETKWGVTVDQTYYVIQITSTKTEILCLLSDFETIRVYDAKTQVAKRNNTNAYEKLGFTIQTNCMCHDSDYNIYATNGYSLHMFDLNSFKLKQVYIPFKSNNDDSSVSNDLFHSLIYMQILNNGKLVLLKDAIQTDNAELFVI